MAGKLTIQVTHDVQDGPGFAQILEDGQVVLRHLDFDQLRDLTQKLISVSFNVGTVRQLLQV